MTMEPIWYQTLGEDAYPIFDNTHLVVLKSDDDTYYNVSNLAGDVNSNNVLDEEDALWIAAYLTGNEPDGFDDSSMMNRSVRKRLRQPSIPAMLLLRLVARVR